MLDVHIKQIRDLNNNLYVNIILSSLKEIEDETTEFTLDDAHLNYIKEVLAGERLFSIRKIRNAVQEYIWNADVHHKFNGKTGRIKVRCPNRYSKSEGEQRLAALEIDIIDVLQSYCDDISAILSHYVDMKENPYKIILRTKNGELTIFGAVSNDSTERSIEADC